MNQGANYRKKDAQWGNAGKPGRTIELMGYGKQHGEWGLVTQTHAILSCRVHQPSTHKTPGAYVHTGDSSRIQSTLDHNGSVRPLLPRRIAPKRHQLTTTTSPARCPAPRVLQAGTPESTLREKTAGWCWRAAARNQQIRSV